MTDLLAYADAATSPELRDVFLARLYAALRHERVTRLLRERAQRLDAIRGHRWTRPTGEVRPE